MALNSELWGTCPVIMAVMSDTEDKWYPGEPASLTQIGNREDSLWSLVTDWSRKILHPLGYKQRRLFNAMLKCVCTKHHRNPTCLLKTVLLFHKKVKKLPVDNISLTSLERMMMGERPAIKRIYQARWLKQTSALWIEHYTVCTMHKNKRFYTVRAKAVTVLYDWNWR